MDVTTPEQVDHSKFDFLAYNLSLILLCLGPYCRRSGCLCGHGT